MDLYRKKQEDTQDANIASTTTRVDNNLKRENLIINPQMDFWQRGAAHVSVADSSYYCDRYIYQKSGSMVHDINRSTDVPTDSTAIYSMEIDCTTADTSLAGTEFSMISQRIEGFRARIIRDKTFTLKFKVKATKTGIYCVSFRDTGNTRSYVVEYTINVSNVWEEKSITITHDASAGTWNSSNGIGLKVGWTLGSGASYHTTAGVWQTGNFIATANQVNALDSTANNFYLTDVQLTEGAEDIPFQQILRDYQDELRLCQRYYEKSYDINVTPGTGTSNGALSFTAPAAFHRPHIQYTVRKRAAATILPYAWALGSQNYAERDSGSVIVLLGSYIQGETCANVQSAAFGAGAEYRMHWTAEAEL